MHDFCEVSEFHCDLGVALGATSRGTAGTNFKSETLKGSFLTNWLNAETYLDVWERERDKTKGGSVWWGKRTRLETMSWLRFSVDLLKLNNLIWQRCEAKSTYSGILAN